MEIGEAAVGGDGITPSSLEGIISLAKAKWQDGQREDALGLIQGIPSKIAGDNAAASAARTLAGFGELQKAEELLTEWLSHNEGKWARRELGLTIRSMGDMPRALAVFDDLCDRYPESSAGFTARFELLFILGRLDELEEEIKSALVAFPSDEWVWNIAARTAERRGNYAEALRLWKAILQFAPHHAMATAGVEALARKASAGSTAAEPETCETFGSGAANLAVRGGRATQENIPKRAVVISNCQSLPIASWLTLFSSETLFDFFGVHVIAPSARQEVIARFIETAKENYDLIISIPLTDEFCELSTGSIATTFAPIPVITISNIYFSGLHPDLTYIGSLGRRVEGPMGDYHSRIALYGYLAGMPLPEVRKLYCHSVYQSAGYYEQYDSSMADIVERDRKVDFGVTRLLQSALKEALCFFSVNHPTPDLFAIYCDKIALYLQAQGLGKRSDMPVNAAICGESLASNYIFPIYPEIAAHHGVPAWGSYAFKPIGNRVNPMGLAEFIEGEFIAFDQAGKEALANSREGQEALARFGNIGP